MGCKQSTEKPQQPAVKLLPEAASAAPQQQQQQQQQPKTADAPSLGSPATVKETFSTRNFLATFISSAEKVIVSQDATIEEKLGVTRSFMNSACEVVKQHFRIHRETTVGLIKSLLPTDSPLLPALQHLDGHLDDGFHRLISGWRDANPASAESISVEEATALIRTALGVIDTLSSGSFESILKSYFANAIKSQKILHLFNKYASNGSTMNVQEFMEFSSVEQGVELNERQALDKVRYRLGSSVTKYNFCSYLASRISNNALDPQRTTNIWQDMTQPLPRYMVYTLSINSKEDFARALEDGARALVLHVREQDSKLYTGTCDLEWLLKEIKANGFTKTPYPIILCLAPADAIHHDMQNALAQLLRTVLGDTLARGIMFDGAILNDPSFSPSALQNKVLLMGLQAPLKPFVGLYVADMHRDGLGVRVTDVREATPASKAGIFKDDWLTHINGREIHNKEHLKEQLRQLHLGEEFLMKKENLDEVRVVVGGAVDRDDPRASKELSDLIFLKLCSPSESRTHAPWEADSLAEDSIASSPPSRDALNDHFSFLQVSHDDSCQTSVMEATTRGVQFVDPECVIGCMWARGMFRENAHCGYLLKSQAPKETATVHLEVLGPPPHLHAAVLVRMNQCFVLPSTTIEGAEITFSECTETDVSVIEMVFELEGKKISLFATFPPQLLRGGFRTLDVCAMPASPTSQHEPQPSETGVLCFITTERQLDGTFKNMKTVPT